MNSAFFKRKVQSILTDNKYDRWVGGYRSGKINLRKLPKVATGSNRVFQRRVERKGKFYSVVIVVDISGSMQGYKMDLAAKSAAELYKALDSNDVEVAVIAFNSVVEMVKDWDWNFKPEVVEQHLSNLMYIQPNQPVDFRVVRDSNQVLARFGDRPMHPPGENFDYIAIQDASTMLNERKGRKIMLVYSDGQPTGDTSGLLRKEVRRVIDEGIITLGFGIHDSAVTSYYPYTDVIQDVQEIYPKTISLLSKHILRG